jgi:beta-glucanase (GH16 family)
MVRLSLLGFAVALLGCAHAGSSGPAGWRLVWHDEFDTPGPPDPARWDYEDGYVRNHERQLYTRRSENVRVEGGHLVIEARREPRGEHAYTSASVHTKHKGEWLYGRIEVRARIPVARGLWPAIWTLGAAHGAERWPDCGELDLMENVGFEPELVHVSVHTAAYNHVKKTHKTTITRVSDLEGWHAYAAEWTPERVDFFVDDRKVFTFANEGTGRAVWPFDRAQYLLLNVAIGGDWGGQHGIDDAQLPRAMLVDYVRVYQR